MLVYLHGFRSSPDSFKARLLATRLAALHRSDEWCCPRLDVSPRVAIAGLDALLSRFEPNSLCLIGSSLGGYYATWLAERYGCRAVLLNPAITPHLDLQHHLGEQTLWGSEERVMIHPHFLEELQDLWVPAITHPKRYLLIAAKGDEVIDWRDMVAKYANAHQHVIEGGDHGLSQFGDLLDEVLAFADSPAASAE